MQSLSLTLSKRLSNSNPLFRFSSNLFAYSSTTTTTSPPPSPISAATATATAFPSFLTAPWSATQSRGITVSGSDVRVANLFENRGRVYEVLKQYHSLGGKTTTKVPSQTVAGYATIATTGGVTRRKEGNSGLKTKREQLLKATALVPLLLIYPNAYSLLAANLFVFWHIRAGIEEILADYVHQEMTREFVMISFKLFLIIAMKDVFLKFVFV
ncbi:hypothetical protein Lal_00004573 [Lupinus albus]|uniref:Putative succinate dehydrogenase (Quinone) n=1 Tax=Lupinus albus TaxID=3870 RepID=A0A6A4N8Z6_LUPAL|nr:putative succinate dehydrogenase (quinone) [Lupinus albus]KAF1865199.1 hypothetical protein Lal_00004573 [Lupinus albus]